MWWPLTAFIRAELFGSFLKDRFLCIDVRITCMNRNGALYVAVTGGPGAGQETAWCNFQAPLTFPCSWELSFSLTFSSLGSPCTVWGTYLLNTFDLLFCLDVCRWEEWRVLHKVLRGIGLLCRGSTQMQEPLQIWSAYCIKKTTKKMLELYAPRKKYI